MAVNKRLIVEKIYDLMIADSDILAVVKKTAIHKWLADTQYAGRAKPLISIAPDASDRTFNQQARRYEDIDIVVSVIHDVRDDDPLKILDVEAAVSEFLDIANRRIEVVADEEIATVRTDEGNYQVDYSIDEDGKHRIADITIKYDYKKNTT
jgi:hypothetical protein